MFPTAAPFTRLQCTGVRGQVCALVSAGRGRRNPVTTYGGISLVEPGPRGPGGHAIFRPGTAAPAATDSTRWIRIGARVKRRVDFPDRAFPRSCGAGGCPVLSAPPDLSVRATRRRRWRGGAAGARDTIPWIVRIQRAASGGRGLRPNPKRRRAAALQGAGFAGRLVGFQRPLRGKPERRHVCALLYIVIV